MSSVSIHTGWITLGMCGIAGFLDHRRQTPEADLSARVRSMADTLTHRGPDSSGTWVDAEKGIALGHRRLAILDLSPAGHQPMASACGRYVVSYNGEIYNFLELRDRLEAKGHRFRGHSDTEVLLAAITEWGVRRSVQEFIGMFALALWDRQEASLYLVRDRAGIKPLYYGRVGELFLFGSELRSLAAHPEYIREIDRDALALYLGRNYVPCPHSIYKGIFKLPPGTMLRVPADGAAVSMEPYWTFHSIAADGAANPFPGDEREAVEQLDRLIGISVKQRMVADVPIGVFLSGGIDSSTVAALMQAQSDKPVKSYAIGYLEADFNEAGHAEAVARHLGTDHRSLMVSPGDALAVIPKLGEMLDEPFADPSQIPTFLVSKLAREATTVVLTGDGGDETFGGYTRHLWCERIARLNGVVPQWVNHAVAWSLTRLAPDHWDRILRFLPASLQQSKPGSKLHRIAGLLGAQDAVEVYRRLMNHWNQAESIVYGSSWQETILDRRGDWPPLSDPTSLLMFLDSVTYLPDNCLAKVDRASMAVSLEARVPLLDHRVLAFAWSLPLGLKISGGIGKQILRKVLYRHVPKALVERPKMGFGVPVRDWMRGPLRDWTEDMLNETRLKNDGYLDPQPIRRKWREHLSGRRDWYNQIWSVVMFQAWLNAQQTQPQKT